MDEGRRRGMREPFSAVSHLCGAAFFAIGLLILMIRGSGDPSRLLSFAIYGVCAICLFLASGLYHSVHHNALWFRRFDHAAIYSMIAGSYTPICVLGLPKPLGWNVLAIEWAIALVGIVSSLSMELVPHWLRVILYIGMGWLAVLVMEPLRKVLPPPAIGWLVAGGILYTVGVVFYATERPKLWPGLFDAHDLWHVFVLAAALCHYALMFYLIG